MPKIAITGNIASGKSEVEKILISKGFTVYDTDKFTHDILDSSKEVKSAFANYDVFEEDKISRSKLGKLVFNHPELKKKLENIIHPLIRKMIKDIKSDKYVFISVPLLYEAEMENLFDYAVFVSADKKIRLKRLMQRNSFTQKEAELRIHAQADENEKLKKADFVISNNGSKEELENCVENMLLQLVQ